MNSERAMFLREKLNTGLFIDFKTWSGFGILWEFAIKQEWWEQFIWNEGVNKGAEGNLIDTIIINPNIFADKIYKFLKFVEEDSCKKQ